MFEKDWEITPDAALFLWPLTGHDYPPAPLRILPTATTADQDNLARRELAAQYQVQYLPGQRQGAIREDAGLSNALCQLHAGQIRVTFTGGPPHTPSGDEFLLAEPSYRAIATISSERGVFAAQTADNPNLRISYCHRDNLERRLSPFLPQFAAGPGSRLTAAREAVTSGARSSSADPAEIIRAVLSAARDAEGVVTVDIQLDEPDWRPGTRYLTWISIPGYGGYLVDVGHEVNLWPASTGTLAAQISRAITWDRQESDPHRSWLR